MSDVTELRCWPACIDAIDWSQEGIIALASDERVELLFPNTISFDRDQDGAQWQHVALKVPWFSGHEVPLKQPASLTNYSIGEEISVSTPIALSWSPPGLARHRRSALAVLTANLTLSIWASDGHPKEESSWYRSLVINKALAHYFELNASKDSSRVEKNSRERIRIKSRIRAFTWAPAISSSDTSTMGTKLSYGPYIVAVCNDDNQLALVLIESPTSAFGAEKDWNAQVLAHVALLQSQDSVLSEPISFDDLVGQQRHLSHVAWSPWSVQGDAQHSVLVYATNRDVRARVIFYRHGRVGFGDEVTYPGIVMRYNGLMKWSPKVEEGNLLTLALFTDANLVYLSVSMENASIVERLTHDLDGRWDSVSGAAWDLAQPHATRLHFSSLLSTLYNPTAVLEASTEGLKALGSPSWRDQVENSAVLFSVRNDLRGNSKIKVWGLATSPLGDFAATCTSVHPSRMIEYGSPNDRCGTIAVSSLRQYHQSRASLPEWDISAEGLLFTLKKMAENTVEKTDHMPSFVKDAIENLTGAYGALKNTHDANSTPYYSTNPTTSAIDMLVHKWKREVFFGPNTLRDRYTILVSYACNSKDSNDLAKTLIAYRLVTASQSMFMESSRPAFSLEILAHHRQLIQLIQTVLKTTGQEDGPARDQNPEEHASPTENPPPQPETHKPSLDITNCTTDICDFCAAPIPFTDLTTATCLNDHQFPRCGLSFLAIQAPAITKYCGICSTPYLNDRFVTAQECTRDPIAPARNDCTTTPTTSIKHTTVPDIQRRTDGDARARNSHGGMKSLSDRDSKRKDDIQQQRQIPPGSTQSTSDGDNSSPATFAQMLFLACDACMYCGGKFIGV